LLGQADMEIETERHRDFVLEEAAQRAMRGIDAADELLHVQPDRHGVVTVTRARRPRRLLAREYAREVVQIAQLLEGQRLVEQDEPRLVAKELAHRDTTLPVLRKFG